MKSDKTITGSMPSGDVLSKTSVPARSTRGPADRSNPLVTIRKTSVSSSKSCSNNVYSSSQESLASNPTSVRRKISAPSIKSSSNSSTKIKSVSAPTPIRTISNIPGSKSGSVGRKIAYRLNNQSNMRRTTSRDRVDSSGNRDKEKENVKLSIGKNQGKSGSSCATIQQLEKEKSMMEKQISELVRNAESKKAEIATLKMEINKLKDLRSDDAVEQLRQELEASQLENQALKERLLQLGAPLETTALSDTQKEQLLLQTNLRTSSLQNFQSSETNLSDAPKSLEMDGGEASGMTMPRHLSDWDKTSNSSISEMSVACLQDRIMQMEETHHSTNEELQATLQELTDLQDQLADLQLENERMSEEKAILLESLCSQTEKLEECRSQIMQLKQLLFEQHENVDKEPTLTVSEREKTLVELLKKAEEANDLLRIKQEELSVALNDSQKNSGGSQNDMILLRDRVRLLESTVESVKADKRLLDSQFNRSQEQLSANQIEISKLKSQLENEQQKVLELQREREAGATSELNALLEETRKDKEKVEERAMKLQEQLAHSQLEVNRYKDQLAQMQEESMVVKNNAHKQVSDMEYRIEQMEAETVQLHQEMTVLREALQESEIKCQRHLEDKRELKANIGELQKTLNETTTQLKDSQKENEIMKMKHDDEVKEWDKFQEDLLTTVRVANEFRTEAQHDVEKLMVENRKLKENNGKLSSEIENLKANLTAAKQEVISATTVPLRTSMAFATSEVLALSNVEKDINVAARRTLGSNKVRDRGANQLSVKSLIESIENATKQVKGQGPTSSCSSSTSSLNSVASDTRSTNSLLFANSNDVFIKPSLRAEANSILRDGKAGSQINRLPRNPSVEGICYSIPNASNTASDQGSSVKTDTDGMKPLPPHPVSILANKLDSMRRNSYGDAMLEKKDPLASLIKGGGSKRNALLKWCQNKALGYKGIDITNFSSSWNDGLAFCALMHSYLPDLIPYDDLDCKDKRRNFTLAFEAAESVGIATTLNINELISQERPDWQSIMTYVTSIYKHFET